MCNQTPEQHICMKLYNDNMQHTQYTNKPDRLLNIKYLPLSFLMNSVAIKVFYSFFFFSEILENVFLSHFVSLSFHSSKFFMKLKKVINFWFACKYYDTKFYT